MMETSIKKKIEYFPFSEEMQNNIKPIYITMPGWKKSTQGIKNFNDLPLNAKKYINKIEELIDCKVTIISTSPERKDTILIVDPFRS